MWLPVPRGACSLTPPSVLLAEGVDHSVLDRRPSTLRMGPVAGQLFSFELWLPASNLVLAKGNLCCQEGCSARLRPGPEPSRCRCAGGFSTA